MTQATTYQETRLFAMNDHILFPYHYTLTVKYRGTHKIASGMFDTSNIDNNLSPDCLYLRLQPYNTSVCSCPSPAAPFPKSIANCVIQHSPPLAINGSTALRPSSKEKGRTKQCGANVRPNPNIGYITQKSSDSLSSKDNLFFRDLEH